MSYMHRDLGGWLTGSLLVGVLASFCLVGVAQAQQPEEIDWTVRYWIDAGASYSSMGPGISGGAGVEFGRNVLLLRSTSTDPSWGSQTWDVSVMYGRAYPIGPFSIAGGVGMSVVAGERYSSFWGDGEGETFEPMLGFPLDGRLEWVPVDFMAIGLHSYANVNTAQPFVGMGVLVRVGNLR